MPSKYIRNLLSKDVLKVVGRINYAVNKNYNKMAHTAGMHIIKIFFEIVFDKLMESNRVILPAKLGSEQERELYITDVQQSHKKYPNVNTGGKVYNAIITGFNPPVSIKLDGERKKELYRRLESGQSFY